MTALFDVTGTQRIWLAWRWLLLAEADVNADNAGAVDPAPLLLILDQVSGCARLEGGGGALTCVCTHNAARSLTYRGISGVRPLQPGWSCSRCCELQLVEHDAASVLMVPLHQEDGSVQGEDSREEGLEEGGEDEDNYDGGGNGDGDDDTESDVPDDKEHYWRQQHQQQQLREQQPPIVAAPISPRPPSKPLPSPRPAAQSPPKQQQQQPAALAPEIAAILEENRSASD